VKEAVGLPRKQKSTMDVHLYIYYSQVCKPIWLGMNFTNSSFDNVECTVYHLHSEDGQVLFGQQIPLPTIADTTDIKSPIAL